MKKISINHIIEILTTYLPSLKITNIKNDNERENDYTIYFFLNKKHIHNVQKTIKNIIDDVINNNEYDLNVLIDYEVGKHVEGKIEISLNNNVITEGKLTDYGKQQVKKNQEELRQKRKEDKIEQQRIKTKNKKNQRIKGIIHGLYIELNHKRSEKERFETDMEQELMRMSNETDQETQAQIWGEELNKLDMEIETLKNKIDTQKNGLQESVIRVIKESVFENKLKKFIKNTWKNPVEKSFIKQIKKYEKDILNDPQNGSKYLQDLQKKNKRLLQTHCSDTFLDELTKLNTDYSENNPTDNSSLDLSNEFDQSNSKDADEGLDMKDNSERNDDMDDFFKGTDNKRDEDDEDNGEDEENEGQKQNTDEKGFEMKKESISKNKKNKLKRLRISLKEKRFLTEYIRVEIYCKGGEGCSKELIIEIIDLLKNEFFLKKDVILIKSNEKKIIVKKLPLNDYNELTKRIKELSNLLNIHIIGTYSDGEYVDVSKSLNESKDVSDILFDSDPEYILNRLDEFFYDCDNDVALHAWEEYKMKLKSEGEEEGYFSWLQFLEDTNGNGQEEINMAVSIIKLNNLIPSLKSFLRITESKKINGLKEYYLNFPTSQYCYEVKTDMTFNPYNTNKSPHLYFDNESTAKYFTDIQKAGHCEYVGKINLTESEENEIEKIRKQLIDSLKHFDWYYAMSDDSDKYKDGLDEEKRIKKIVEKLNTLTNSNEGTQLYDKYNPFKHEEKKTERKVTQSIKDLAVLLVRMKRAKDEQSVIDYYNEIKDEYFFGYEIQDDIKKHFNKKIG